MRRFALLLTALVYLPLHLQAEDPQEGWHQFRGPTGTGVSLSSNPPTEWSETKNVQWKVPIPGQGTSTPIIWQDKVFLLTAIDTKKVDPTKPRPEDQPKRVFNIKHPNTYFQFVVLCLDRKTGKELWKQNATKRVPHEGHHGDNDFAAASPVAADGKLFCWFGSAGLYCYNLEGNKLWERDLGKAWMGASLGEGCSPAIRHEKLVIVRDQARQSTIEVLDTKTGKTLWKKKRDEPNAWATPKIIRHSGRTQVITAASNLIRSYDFHSGKIIWQCQGLTGNVTPVPVVHEDLVICMSGYQGYAVMAVKLSSTGDVTGTDQVVWRKNRGTPYIPSPLLYKGMLYFTQSNQAILTCLDAKTGAEILGRTQLPGLSNIYASPVGADDRVYFTGRNGTTVVLKRSTSFEVLATNRLNERFDASPAVAGNQLFLRGAKSLYCLSEQN